MRGKKKNIKSVCDFIKFKNNRLHYKYKKCSDKSYKPINILIKKFPNTYQFCKDDLNTFVLLLRKGVYPYEYMDGWEKFNEASLPDFYSELNKEGIIDEDYLHARKI